MKTKHLSKEKILAKKLLLLLITTAAIAWTFPQCANSQIEVQHPQPNSVEGSLVQKDKSELDLAAKLYRSGKFSEALKHFRTVADSGTDNGDARIMMGYCYFEMKKYQEALQEYNRAAKEGKLISIRNKAQKLASRLDSEIRGICPGNCLKPSMPGWHKMKVPGTPDRLVWMVFPYLDPAGKGGSEYWSNDHMGEVIEYENGRPLNKGKCPICHGTTHVSLPK